MKNKEKIMLTEDAKPGKILVSKDPHILTSLIKKKCYIYIDKEYRLQTPRVENLI